MKIAWSEILRLLGTDEFKVGVLLLLVSGLFLIPRAAGALTSMLRKRAYKDYATSISFGREEVERALRGYVRHEGMLADPSAKMDLADALSAPRKCVFRMLDDFIVNAKNGKHLFIFADCGMGKTTFLINYFHTRRRRLRRRRTSIVLISLSKDGYLEEIEAVPAERRSDTVILMDAFDEDPLVLEGVQKRLTLIVSMTSSFKAVVISCRSQFFASDSEIPVGTGTIRVGPTPAGQSKEYEFNRFYLAPFDDERISRYIRLAFPGPTSFLRRRSAREIVNRVPSLVMRPMLLAHISDVIDGERGSLMSQADIYQAIVSAWVKREEPWVSSEALLQFSKKFALNIFELRHERGGEHCSKDELIAMAKLWNIQVRSELLTGRSLLNRTEDGRCKFAHRSIMEYFVSEGILDGSSGRSVDMTSQIASFIFERLHVKPGGYAGKLDYGSRLEIVDAEKRLGYSTNYNLIHEDGEEINPQFVYGLKVVTEVGESVRLGEHLQEMLDRLSRGDRVCDVRIAVSETDHELTGYLSIWSEHKAVLSRVRLSSDNWAAIIGRKWSARNFWNLVGRLASSGRSSADISYRAATYCNSADDFLRVDSASGCKVLSADVDMSSGGIVLRLIPGFTDAGPWSSFGILKGGSLTLITGKKFAVLTERVWEKDEANLPGRLMPQERALVPPFERWDVRERG